MVPKKIHFIFVKSYKFNFLFCHFVHVISAKLYNPDYDVTVYYTEDSDSIWWKNLKTRGIKTVKIPPPQDSINGKKFGFIEHSIDFLKLKILNEQGGIYLDLDVLTLKSYDVFLDKKFVMGLEELGDQAVGLCNAVIMSEPGSAFIARWIDAYKNYDPGNWNQMSVVTPYNLSKTYPDFITVIGRNCFYKYDYHSILMLFNGEHDTGQLSECYGVHFWGKMTYNPIMRHIDQFEFRKYRSAYNDLAAKIYEFTGESL